MTPAQEVKKRMEGKPCPDCGKESWGVYFTHPNNDLKELGEGMEERVRRFYAAHF